MYVVVRTHTHDEVMKYNSRPRDKREREYVVRVVNRCVELRHKKIENPTSDERSNEDNNLLPNTE
jgi:hypothetical protein